MRLEDKLRALWETPEGRALIFKVLWYISLGMMVLGYIIIAYMLFFQ
jgi:Flp pilus assembly protein TadB